MVTYTLKVVNIFRETDDAATICFKQPGLKKIKYKPGQYLTVIVNVNNRKYKRAYSLSSSPNINDTLNITVKRLFRGVVSNHLIDIVKEGDLLEVIEPMGNFVYDHDVLGANEIFLWGAGSGITPLYSILKSALNSGNKVNLFYCNRTIEQTIFYEDLMKIVKENSEQFSLNLFYTEEKQADAFYGRIKEENVFKALDSSNISNTCHFICGPIGLKNTVQNALLQKGVSSGQIFLEEFEHIINENDLKDIQTQFVEIDIKGEKIQIEVLKGKSILEAGLDLNIDLPYSCQTGTCTLCKAMLVDGLVKKIGDEKMDFELNDNEQLLCCSYPLNDNVKFKFD